MAKKLVRKINDLSELKLGCKIEDIITGEVFVILANNGKRVTAIESVALITVNDHAHKEWFCTSNNLPLNKLNVGDIIFNKHSYVITHISDYILHANRSIEIMHPDSYLLLC